MRLILFVVSFVLFSPATIRAQGKLKVFVLAGQSNMEGAGQIQINPRSKNGGKGSLEYLVKDPKTAKKYAHAVNRDGSWRVRDDVWIWYLGRKGGLGVDTPFVMGGDVTVDWRDIEKTRGEFRWGDLDRQLQAQADYLLGKAHLGQLKLTLAERYLEKSLTGMKGFRLEESRAHLVVCLRMQKKTGEADALFKRLKEPGHPHIQAILTTPRPRLADEKLPKAPSIARIGDLPARASRAGSRQLPHLKVLPRSAWKAKSTTKSRATPQALSKIFRMKTS